MSVLSVALMLAGGFGSDDLDIVRMLLALGATMPRQLRVCDRCALVFHTKRVASRCQSCHARPHSPIPGSVELGPDTLVRFAGIPGVVDASYYRLCAWCGRQLYPRRAHAECCSDSCRKARSRQRAAKDVGV